MWQVADAPVPDRTCESRESLIPNQSRPSWFFSYVQKSQKVFVEERAFKFPEHTEIHNMSTTINRQLSLLVQGLLGKYGIDNLQLEIDLVASLQRMWVEGGRDPQKLAVLREEILSEMLCSAAMDNAMAEMEGRVKKCMGISVDGRARYRDMIRFLIKKDKEGQKIEDYAKWADENPFTAPKFFKIAEKPDLLMTTWEMAFQTKQVIERPEHQPFVGGEDHGVPNPFQKPDILRRSVSVDRD